MPGRVVTELTRELRIINEKGLHARASAKFVETVERFDARAHVEKDGERVSGDSIMGLLMLVAPRGNLRRVPIDRGRGEEKLRQVQGRHVYIWPQNTPDRGAQMPGVGGVHHQRNLWDL